MSSLASIILKDIEAVLGASNIFGVDDDGDSLSVCMMGDYMLGLWPMHPLESERPGQGVDGYDDSRDVPYEYWEAAIEELESQYKEAARLLSEKLPEFEITIGHSYEGPVAPGDPLHWHNEYFKEVPSSFELKLKTA
ncbi:hypothetical protein ACQ4N7_28390 [Nodosilinea sp. AN01ver1]|uniref:hypothetical protein n=1 Tax=Nodosilinea sp. AN01ver1 TaxID=3423362 RepID=UPI003D31429D